MKYTSLPNGAYLVFGPDVAPQVCLLTAESQANYWEAERIANASSDPERYRKDVYGRYFGARDITAIVPAWSRDAMQLIATQYEGAHQVAVRGMAAAIALGRTFSRDQGTPKDSGEGGTKVPVPKPPKGPKGGGDKVSAFDSLTTGQEA